MICENCGKEIESYIGVSEFCRRTGLSRSTIEADVACGKIKAFRYGGNSLRAGRILIPETEVEAFKEKFFKPATE